MNLEAYSIFSFFLFDEPENLLSESVNQEYKACALIYNIKISWSHKPGLYKPKQPKIFKQSNQLKEKIGKIISLRFIS